MSPSRIVNLFRKVTGIDKPRTVPAGALKPGTKLGKEQLDMLSKMGHVVNDMQSMIEEASKINFERRNVYTEIDRALYHPIVSGAVELTSEVATSYSQFAGATVWVTAENKQYQEILSKLLDRIGIEEKIFDWSWTTAAYGDLIMKVEGEKGVGITSVDDSQHPMNMSRVDYKGQLLGFYETPLGMIGSSDKKLQAPWDYVHFRLLGVKRKRPGGHGGDTMYQDFSSVRLIAPESRMLTTKYGSSVITNALPIYKKLRMAEDSVMLARLSKGILRYLYKVKVSGQNMEAVSSLVDLYSAVLTKARAIDTTDMNKFFDEKYNPAGVLQDIIVPVWDDVGDLTVEKLGGETDIRFIADVEDLRNQLACALRVPLQLLGGFTEDLPNGLGTSAIERLDIRFARQARRLQRALIDGIRRLCQLELAYRGMNPDLSMFKVHMAETSTAEEEELRDALDKAMDVVGKFVTTVTDLVPNVDRVALLDYINAKILRLDDFDLNDYLLTDKEAEGKLPLEAKNLVEKLFENREKRKKATVKEQKLGKNLDLRAPLPGKLAEQWNSKYKDMKVRVEKNKVSSKK